MRIQIANKTVGNGHPVFIIAEIGINHNGNLAIAKKLIDAAVVAGCDAVKFQKRTIEAVYSKDELEKPREVPEEIIESAINKKVLPEANIKRLVYSNLKNITNGDLKYALEFSEFEYQKLDTYCKQKGIIWLASPWDIESVDFLEKFSVPCYKIASAALTDIALLRYVAAKQKPVMLSTGMSTMEEIKRAVDVLGRDNLVILHCVSTYPTADQELNLGVIETLKKEFPGVPIGYSGHEHGTTMSVCAVVMGACVVERHFTLDRSMWGSDHAASLEPAGLMLMVNNIRRFEKARGDGEKRVLDSEVPIKKKLRRF